MTSQVAVANDPKVADAAGQVLRKGSAVDAVAAGVFAAAALHPGVLLGPVQILVGGPGVWSQAIDGRVRQGGLGLKRPRGFRAEDTVPDAARVGVPALPAALLAAVGAYGKLSFSAVVAPAAALASEASDGRAKLLRRIARLGPAAMARGDLAEELVERAGELAGGVVSAKDLAEVSPTVASARATKWGGHDGFVVPWLKDSSHEGNDVRVIAAADSRGRVAVACYEVAPAGLLLEACELLAPFAGVPVRRGERRVPPGEPRPAAAPIALGASQGAVAGAAGVGMTSDAEIVLRDWLASAAAKEVPPRFPPSAVAVQRVPSGWATLS